MAEGQEATPALVWTRERPSPRRQAPSVEQIVARAITIADTEGLDALSMRRVAGDLGSGTASLYRYVTNRDELLDLMIDTVRGEGEQSTPTGDWRADLTSIAHAMRAGLLRHPWLAGELTGRPTLGPNSLRATETALAAAMARTDDITLATRIVDTVRAYVFGAVATELADSHAHRRSGLTKDQWQASVAPYMRQIIDSGDYPLLARRVVEAEPDSAADRFEFGLACVLDGVDSAYG